MRDLDDLEEDLLITALRLLRVEMFRDLSAWSDTEFYTAELLLEELHRNRSGLDEHSTLY